MQGAAFAFFHDMAVTEHYYVLFQNPTVLDFKKLLTEYTLAKVSLLFAAASARVENVYNSMVMRPSLCQPYSDACQAL